MRTVAVLLLSLFVYCQSFAFPSDSSYHLATTIDGDAVSHYPKNPLIDLPLKVTSTIVKSPIPSHAFFPAQTRIFGLANQTTTEIYTDFEGFWGSSIASPNTVMPDNSHNLLGFTYNGITYSTGVNDATLTTKGVSFTPGKFRALPVAGITGTNPSASSGTYLALAKKVDGVVDKTNTSAVAHLSIKEVLIDGINGLDLGTGVTNLPKAANLSFQIFNIDPTKTEDNEPDIILTQIADPSAGNDVFSFVDAAGNLVGNEIMQDMTKLSKFGTYRLDLYNLTPNTPYSSATAYSPFSSSDTRDIRLVAFKLSDFGITAANASQAKALKITPSSTSDYAFIGYNYNSINLPPNVTKNDGGSQTTICSGGTANMKIDATAAGGGSLNFSWEESTDGGFTWNGIINGGSYSGATTNTLSVANAVNGRQYRAIVIESANTGAPVTTSPFSIVIGSYTAPSSVTITSAGTTLDVYIGTPTQLTSTVSGGSNLYYQWQQEVTGVYQDITGANLSTYVPPVGTTGVTNYRLKVSSGGIGCPNRTSSQTALNVTCVAPKVSAAVCSGGAATLEATTTSGTLNWYRSDATLLGTGTKITVPNQTAAATYYAESSGCPTSSRIAVKTTVNPQSVGGTLSGGTTLVSSTNSTTLTLNGNTGSIVRWESSVDNFSNTTTITNTTSQLTVNNVIQETGYRAVVKSGACAATFSSTAVLSMSSVLPIHRTSVKAVKEKEGISLKWTAFEQENTKLFEIEKSVDGYTFVKAYTFLPTNIQDEKVIYSWMDRQPIKGGNYYRIKELFYSGTHSYSPIVMAAFNNEVALSVYPNPIKASLITIETSAPLPTHWQIFNANGSKVAQGVLQQKTEQVNVNYLRSGIYYLQVEKLETIKLVKY